MKRQCLVLLMGLGLSAAMGCDPVAGDRYQGEVLATIRGLVVEDMDGPPGVIPPLEVALVWGVWEGDDPLQTRVLAQKVPIKGTFPADFELTVRQPPPAGAGVRQGEVTVNFAFIAAIARDSWQTGTALRAGRTVEAYGHAREAVLHVDKAITNEAWSTLLGGVRTAGFHLMEMVDVGEMSALERQMRIDACRELAAPSELGMCNSVLEPGAYHPRLAAGDLEHRIRMEVTWEPTILGGTSEPQPQPDAGAGGLVSR
jgi:hypothetical protein